jgi:hypothetical protein
MKTGTAISLPNFSNKKEENYTFLSFAAEHFLLPL